MKIALYLARNGSALDKAIDACTARIGFSHVELVFSDGVFFSSSPQDGGVRFKKIDPDPSHWILYDVAMTPHEESLIRAFCQSQVGKKYDWAGVFGFIVPIHDDRTRWFCSEICIAAIQEAGLLGHLDCTKVSPNSLYMILEACREIGGTVS